VVDQRRRWNLKEFRHEYADASSPGRNLRFKPFLA
jgi:hypothetical protein